MRRLAILLVIGLGAGLQAPLAAQGRYVGGGCGGDAGQIIPFASETLTIRSVPAPLSKKIYDQQSYRASIAIISVEADAIRFWMDGSIPNPTSGHLMPAGDYFSLCNFDMISRFRALRVNGDATLRVTYFAHKK